MAWEIDTTCSSARFLFRQVTTNVVRGHFRTVSGYLHVDEDRPVHMWMDVHADGTSLDYVAEARNAPRPLAKGSDASQYRAFSFRSCTVELIVGAMYAVSGELTIMGTTRLATFHTEIHQYRNAGEGRRVSVAAWAKLSSTDFGIPLGRFAGLGHEVSSDSIKLEIDVTLVSRTLQASHAVSIAKPESASEEESQGVLQQAA